MGLFGRRGIKSEYIETFVVLFVACEMRRRASHSSLVSIRLHFSLDCLQTLRRDVNIPLQTRLIISKGITLSIGERNDKHVLITNGNKLWCGEHSYLFTWYLFLDSTHLINYLLFNISASLNLFLRVWENAPRSFNCPLRTTAAITISNNPANSVCKLEFRYMIWKQAFTIYV